MDDGIWMIKSFMCDMVQYVMLSKKMLMCEGNKIMMLVVNENTYRSDVYEASRNHAAPIPFQNAVGPSSEAITRIVPPIPNAL